MSTNSNNQPKGTKTASYTLRQQEFLKSDAASLARIELKMMVSDPKYNTRDAFSAKTSEDVPFVEKHMRYLCDHPKLNPRHYLSNLKLMTRIKS